MSLFGELKAVQVRRIWPHEALDFTPWLAANIQKLGEVLGLDLEILEREASVGSFSLDLLARDLGTSKMVIIENQFGMTDHDHFGKLLTYAAGFDASAIIWIAETIRDEHRSALEWLNQRTDVNTQFFAVTVEVFQIDDSKPAFQFNPIVLPNEWQKEKQRSPEVKLSSKAEAYRAFFQLLIDDLRDTHRFTNARAAQPQSWYNFSSGFSGIVYSVSFTQRSQVRVELYIDQGEVERNKHLFDWLTQKRSLIETEYGATLSWERLDSRRASRIGLYQDGAILSTEAELTTIRGWIIDNLLRFKQVFAPHLSQYKQHIQSLSSLS